MVTIREYGGSTTRRRSTSNRRRSSRSVVPARRNQVAKGTSGRGLLPSPADIVRAIWRNRRALAGVGRISRGDLGGFNDFTKKRGVYRLADSLGSLVGAGSMGRRIGSAAQSNADKARSILGKRPRASGGGAISLPQGPGIRMLPPPPSSSQSNMARKRRVSVSASSVSRFKRAKKTKVAAAYVKGAVLKAEYGGSITDPNACYIGVNSHPLRPTLRAIALAVTRLLAKRWGQDLPDFQQQINGATTADSSVRVRITYRVAHDGLPLTSTIDFSNNTWAYLADNIMHRLCSLITASVVYFELLELQFANSIGTTANVNPLVTFDAKKIKISVSGRTTLKVQNSTLSDDATDSTSTDHVGNNPLRGRIYSGFGQNHGWTFSRDTTGIMPILRYDTDAGWFTFLAGNADLPDSMLDAIKKPPVHKAFTHFTKSSPIKLMPGTIKTTTVSKTYTMSLNKWVLFLMNPMRTGASLAAVVNEGLCNLGSTAMIGLEHEVNIGSEPNVALAFQADNEVKAIAKYYKQPFCNAVYDVAVSGIVV